MGRDGDVAKSSSLTKREEKKSLMEECCGNGVAFTCRFTVEIILSIAVIVGENIRVGILISIKSKGRGKGFVLSVVRRDEVEVMVGG